jgi:hypothetical protein
VVELGQGDWQGFGVKASRCWNLRYSTRQRRRSRPTLAGKRSSSFFVQAPHVLLELAQQGGQALASDAAVGGGTDAAQQARQLLGIGSSAGGGRRASPAAIQAE